MTSVHSLRVALLAITARRMPIVQQDPIVRKVHTAPRMIRHVQPGHNALLLGIVQRVPSAVHGDALIALDALQAITAPSIQHARKGMAVPKAKTVPMKVNALLARTAPRSTIARRGHSAHTIKVAHTILAAPTRRYALGLLTVQRVHTAPWAAVARSAQTVLTGQSAHRGTNALRMPVIVPKGTTAQAVRDVRTGQNVRWVTFVLEAWDAPLVTVARGTVIARAARYVLPGTNAPTVAIVQRVLIVPNIIPAQR
jgi:hypothetical protein